VRDAGHLHEQQEYGQRAQHASKDTHRY
jgi:hypothetical protein